MSCRNSSLKNKELYRNGSGLIGWYQNVIFTYCILLKMREIHRARWICNNGFQKSAPKIIFHFMAQYYHLLLFTLHTSAYVKYYKWQYNVMNAFEGFVHRCMCLLLRCEVACSRTHTQSHKTAMHVTILTAIWP